MRRALRGVAQLRGEREDELMGMLHNTLYYSTLTTPQHVFIHRTEPSEIAGTNSRVSVVWVVGNDHWHHHTYQLYDLPK